MRVNRVAKARKAQRPCCKCSTAINVGDSYKWIKGRYGPKRTFCKDHSPRQSDMTSSDKLARLYSAQESIEDAVSLDELITALECAASDAREVGEEYQESADNIRETFSESNTADECEQKHEDCESWADELEQAQQECEEIRDRDDEDFTDAEGEKLSDELIEEERMDEARQVADSAADELQVG